MPSVGPRALPPMTATPGQAILLDLMVLCWVLAVAVAIWGAVTESARADRAKRRELATESEPGPTPGIDGFLERWGLWALCLAGAGLILLGIVSSMARV